MSSNVAASSFSGCVISDSVLERNLAFLMAKSAIQDLPPQYQRPIMEKLKQIEDIALDLLPLQKRISGRAAA